MLTQMKSGSKGFEGISYHDGVSIQKISILANLQRGKFIRIFCRFRRASLYLCLAAVIVLFLFLPDHVASTCLPTYTL